MVKLPVVSGADAVKAFQRDVWRIDRQKGSHVVLLKPGYLASLSVPLHSELAAGTLRALIRAAGLNIEEFAALL